MFDFIETNFFFILPNRTPTHPILSQNDLGH